MRGIRYGEEIQVIREGPGAPQAALLGLLAGVAGTLAMDAFSRTLAAFEARLGDEESAGDGGSEGESADGEQALDDIALAGPYYREGEPSTETTARVLWRKARGETPPPELRKRLGSVVHFSHGMSMGALYGLARNAPDRGADLLGGIALGVGLWLIADELLVPLLGLARGPTAQGLDTHARALATHLVYGTATAAAAGALRRVV